MNLSIEFCIWVLLPIIIALFISTSSIQLSIKRGNNLSWAFTAPILALTGSSGTMLYLIVFKDTWPSFIPHLIIGISIVLLGLQTFILKRIN